MEIIIKPKGKYTNLPLETTKYKSKIIYNDQYFNDKEHFILIKNNPNLNGKDVVKISHYSNYVFYELEFNSGNNEEHFKFDIFKNFPDLKDKKLMFNWRI